MKRLFRIWKKYFTLATNTFFSNRIDSAGYFLGKSIRFVFFLALIISIYQFGGSIGGYNKFEVLFFFVSFNIVDEVPQIAFRGIYDFPQQVRRGDFDFFLTKPLSPLFQSLFQRPDILDIIFMIPVLVLYFWSLSNLSYSFTAGQAGLYVVFLVFGLLIAASFHVVSAAISVMVVENAGFIWLYRDGLTVGRFPQEMFKGGLRFLFTYIIPVFIMVSYPVKALLGILELKYMIIGALYVVVLGFVSYGIWKFALKRYSSASS